MDRWNQMKKEHKRFERLVTGFIIFVFLLVFLLIIVYLIGYVFIAYKVVQNPEMIGEWINRLIKSIVEGTNG